MLQLIQELQHLLRKRPAGSVLVQVVVAHREEPSLLEALAGVLKAAQQEYPQLQGQLIEIEGEPEEGELLDYLRENQLRTLQEPHICYRDGKRWVREWQEHLLISAPITTPWKEGGCYLISGGAGGLARLFVQEIARQVQQATVILVGRSALSQELGTRLEQIGHTGLSIDYQQVDVSDSSAVHALIQRVLRQHGHLDGIIHAAGVLRDSLLLNKTPEDVEAVLAPKVFGVEHLDEASQEIPLDFFVLCSSLVAVAGNVGQTDYAAANAYLDAFAHTRAAQVLAGERQGKTVSINWPYWEAGGMQVDASTLQIKRQQLGLGVMETGTGMKTLYQALALGAAQVVVLHGQVERIKQQWLRLSPEPSRGEVSPLERTSSGTTEEEQQAVTTRGEEAMREKASAYFKRQLAALIKLPMQQIEASVPLSDYGFDSIMAVHFTNLLEESFGPLSKTLLFEHPTLDSVTAYFLHSYPEQLRSVLRIEEIGASHDPYEAIPQVTGGRIAVSHASSQSTSLQLLGHLHHRLPLLRKGTDPIPTNAPIGDGSARQDKEARISARFQKKDVLKLITSVTDIYSVILAPNPSLLTGAGTKTIVLGDQSTGAVVIDPATDDPEYLAAIIQEGQRYGGIRRILITHGHPDHVGGASALRAQLGVPILAFSHKKVPFADEAIADNTLFPIGEDMLRAIYTPGHCFDHLCFWLEKQRILFAGDLVTSSGPALIFPPPEGDLQDYMHSLERVQNLESVEIIPAHGESILRPQEMLAECLARCQQRKQQILAAVHDAPQGIDIKTIVQALYSNVDASLYDFMAISVLSNLSMLEREGKVKHIENKQSEQKDYWILMNL